MVTGKDSAAIVQKLKTKVKNKISVANESRNEYLLALIALNTAQGCYDKNDLPRIMERLDGMFYDYTKELLLKFVEFEKDTTGKINVKSDHMRDQIEKINRDIDVKEFINDFPQAFKHNVPLQFESAAVDTVSEIVVDDVTKISLGRILGQLFSKDEDLAAAQIIKDNELIGANALMAQYIQNPDLGNPTQSREMIVEIQNQQDELYSQREVLRAQIEALQTLNVQPIMVVKKDTYGTIVEGHDAVADDQLTVKQGDEVKILEQNEGNVYTYKFKTIRRTLYTGRTGTISPINKLKRP